jgi:hypothetical protein
MDEILSAVPGAPVKRAPIKATNGNGMSNGAAKAKESEAATVAGD